MLFTLILLGFVNSSCVTRNFEECLSLNVEYQESCQLSQGECRPRPVKCTEIDATYPQNCKTSECYYSKRFNKCLSQPFTRLLNEVGNRGDQHNHQDGSISGTPIQESYHTEGGPLPSDQGPDSSTQSSTSMPPQQHNQTSQNDDLDINQSEEEEDEHDTSDNPEEYDDSDEINDNPIVNNEPWNDPQQPINNNSTNSTNSTIDSNGDYTDSTNFNDTYTGFQYLIEEEIKSRLNESDERKQIEIKSSLAQQLMIAFISMIIMI
ncbi:unnamed protein product [Paramecium sonneborni]|uniref:Uncharacterized protein n=1 Tax=Paramecium sonneborni TaxID=65129 RepID=A0A8S1RC99_9CILI|nr:unnamed protein product [Paramecium sonneborni]